MMTEDIIHSVLQKKIDILVKGIVGAMPEPPQAIYLVGGYGRGEGSWYEDEKGLHPYNDFDLAVITEKPLSQAKTNLLRKALAQDVGIRWVDIDFYNQKSLKGLKSIIHDIDLIKGSTCIYGDSNAFEICPSLDNEKVGFYDVLRLYQTRIWTLLGSWDGDFHDLNGAEAMFFKNQMAKAVLASSDLYLITRHAYTSSYRSRVNALCSLFSNEENLCKMAKWALEEKLRPSSESIGSEEMRRLYCEVRYIFINALETSMGRCWKNFKEPDKTKKWFVFHTKYLLGRIYETMVSHQFIREKYLDIFIAQNYMLMADLGADINVEFVKKAESLLHKWGYINDCNNHWTVLHNAVADARNNL